MFSLASWVELNHCVWTRLPSGFLSEVNIHLWALELTPDEIKVSLCLLPRSIEPTRQPRQISWHKEDRQE